MPTLELEYAVLLLLVRWYSMLCLSNHWMACDHVLLLVCLDAHSYILNKQSMCSSGVVAVEADSDTLNSCSAAFIMQIVMCYSSAGAGQGIGRAFAHALGKAGASVAVVEINFNNAQIVTEELRSKGINSIAVHADVSKKADCAK